MLIPITNPNSPSIIQSYHLIFHPIILITLLYAILAPFTEQLNAFLVVYFLKFSKRINILKYFYIRCFISSSIGEFVFSCLAVVIIWYGSRNKLDIYTLIFTTYLTKIIWSIAGLPIANFIVIILKKTEKIDIIKINNPFKSNSCEN